MQLTPVQTGVAVGVLLVAAWTASFAAGGVNVVPPHAFYLPVVLAGARCGAIGGLLTGAASAVIAGPLLPADVAEWRAQHTTDWIVRGGFFVVMGAFFAVLLRAKVDHEREEMEHRAAEAELRHAFASGQLRVEYQPIVTLDGGVAGAEALLRWNHPLRGEVPPDEFVPLAERTGLIVPIGEYVLRTAVAQLATWREELGADAAPAHVAVNVSPRELERPEFTALVATALHEAGLPPSALTIEVTETALIGDLERSIDHLRTIKSTGVGISVDDFGVGYGSLTYAHRFPVDALKIDRSFISALPASSNLVGGIIMLARSLGMSVIAEGVETTEQAEELRSLGADLAQGWLFGRAAPGPVIAAALAAEATHH